MVAALERLIDMLGYQFPAVQRVSLLVRPADQRVILLVKTRLSLRPNFHEGA